MRVRPRGSETTHAVQWCDMSGFTLADEHKELKGVKEMFLVD